MRKARKTLALVLAMFSVLALVLSGCKGSTTTTDSDTTKEAEKAGGDKSERTVIDFYFDKGGWTDVFNGLGELMLEKTGTGFKMVPYSDTTSYQTTIKQSMQTNNPAPLFTWWSGFRMKELVDAGYVEDLTDEWKNYYEKAGLSPDLADAFSVDGKIYGAPLNVSYWYTYYNKKVFDQYGLKEPETWDEFIAICDKLLENGITPIGLQNEPWFSFVWFSELLVRYDADLYDRLMVGEVSYTDPEVIKCVEIFKDMIEKGYFAVSNDSEKELLPEFVKGNIAMLHFGGWYQGTIENAGLEPETDFSAFLLPSMSGEPVVIYETGPITVSKNAANKEAALAILREYYSKESQEYISKEMGWSPLVPGVEADSQIVNKLVSQIKEKGYRQVQRYWEATAPQISEFAADEYVKLALNPESYMEVLEAIQAEAENYWNSVK